ncbi:AAA family ATPase [Altererythrobacter rubellus]|uniref:AAA family ATPase n=1 Tax=Altererythrobacter rubellus TaxID=2173831 RepID=A0A9Y2F4U7_9SPHN|nr:AAA family ATPase [Altererythrobacter rubellus]WIW95468.1 AAA family ATPase [Altererythrobacter rubellus]
MDPQDIQQTVEFFKKAAGSFEDDNYGLTTESYETAWGIKTTSGKSFKLSNHDVANAFQDIVDNWTEWSQARLNVNSANPDDTLRDFSKAHFSAGSHKDLAEVQRRGFLHLINSIAFAAGHTGTFNRNAWDSALTKADYDEALSKLRKASSSSEALSGMSATPAPRPSAGARETGGDNILFYGAPGTGKSHDVWEKVGNSPSFATVFHPDMQNSDFAGTLKPGVDESGNPTYTFRPGPFARAVAHAWKNRGEKVYLVIEELNRAVAAAVFGELFQLLDRKPDGTGRYKVDFPSPEFADWYEAETGEARDRLSLPSNLWILATMNSADQGVYPLDTAFRRRWRQYYLPIDYAKAPDAPVKIATPSGTRSISWRTFIEALNNYLSTKLEIGEDRLVGPRFVDKYDLKNERIPGKLLIYLWDDLLRHQGRVDLFDEDIKTYGKLHEREIAGKQIFSDKFLETIADGAGEADVSGDEPTP